jgi:aspartyl aminopeptidase
MTAAERAQVDDLLEFLQESPTSCQAVASLCRRLEAGGYTRFDDQSPLSGGDRRYCLVGQSALFAFQIGDDPLRQGFRLVGAHLDVPGLKIKPNSLIAGEGCLKLSTEVYGGPILNTWFDRPLTLAGRVILHGDSPLRPETRLIDLDRPRLIIPNLAIHMNRSVNDGVKIEAQKALLPILGLTSPGQAGATDLLVRLLAEALAVEPTAIADFDLFLVPCTRSERIGLDDELIAAFGLDDRALALAAVNALLAGGPHAGINMLALFDHEEVGSQSSQGAASIILRDLLEQIMLSLGGSRSDFLASLPRSFLISADQAHAVHPNYGEYADATSRPRINGGPVIKSAANRSYTSDADSSAVFQSLCRAAGVPWQTFTNRSDLRGGSTIGPTLTGHLPIRAVDVGNPIWAMHSICETGGVFDHCAMQAVLSRFFSLTDG